MPRVNTERERRDARVLSTGDDTQLRLLQHLTQVCARGTSRGSRGLQWGPSRYDVGGG